MLLTEFQNNHNECVNARRIKVIFKKFFNLKNPTPSPVQESSKLCRDSSGRVVTTLAALSSPVIGEYGRDRLYHGGSIAPTIRGNNARVRCKTARRRYPTGRVGDFVTSSHSWSILGLQVPAQIAGIGLIYGSNPRDFRGKRLVSSLVPSLSLSLSLLIQLSDRMLAPF